MTRPIDPQAAMEVLWNTAKPYAQAKANRIYCEEYRKTLKARLMKSCSETAIGAQEREAYADEQYRQHLESLREAVEQEETLRWQMVSAQAAIEIWRSLEASNRTQDRAAR